MTFQLRDYQNKTLVNIINSINSGHKSIIVNQPPRTGKSVIIADLIKRMIKNNKKILFIVHRKELVDQLKNTLIEHEVDLNYVTLSTIQSLVRLNELPKIDVVVVDEAHHILSNSYKKVLNNYPDKYKFLFTATPIRTDGEGFENVADDLINGQSIQWLTKNKFLSEFDYYAPNDINSNLLKATGKEFSKDSITKSFKPKIYGNAVKTYLKLAHGKKAIVFTHNVETSQRVADEFNKSGIKAVNVTGKTNKNKRIELVEKFKNGDIDILVNAELFTEGLDLPNVDVVIQLRPTQSLSLFLQFSMRALNYRLNKRAIIIDHVNNVSRFGLPNINRTWTLKGNKKSKKETLLEKIKNPIMTCENCLGTFYKKDLIDGLFCPYCNFEIKNTKQDYEVESEIELKKITDIEIKKEKKEKASKKVEKLSHSTFIKNASEADLKTFKDFQAYAKAHGYKSGWAYVNFKKRIGGY